MNVCFRTILMSFTFVLTVHAGLLHSLEGRATWKGSAQINEKISTDPGTSSPKEEDAPVRYENQKTPPSEFPQSGGSAGKKAAPLREFVPSEKIPGDQAVDFPADI